MCGSVECQATPTCLAEYECFTLCALGMVSDNEQHDMICVRVKRLVPPTDLTDLNADDYI